MIFANALNAPATPLASLLNPSAGQEVNNLTAASEQPGTELIGLRVDPPGCRVQRLVFKLSHRAGAMDWTKLANFRLIIDANGNGNVDPGEENSVGGVPSLNSTNDTLRITFNELFMAPVNTTGGLILVADLGRLAAGDGFTVEVEPGTALMDGGGPFLAQVAPVTHLRGSGVILSNPPCGPLGNRLGTGAAQSGVELYAFTLSGADRQVQSLEFTLSGIKGVAAADITAATLYADTDGNGMLDYGEPIVASSGQVTIAGATGTIRFNTSFAAGRNFLMTANLANLAAGDQFTIGLPPAQIHLDQGQAVGTAAAVAHNVESPLAVTGLTSGCVLDQLLPGRLVYSDLTTLLFINPIPAGLYKQVYIRTRNAQRDQTGSGLISFSVNRRVRIHIALDDRIAQVPAWLSDWQVNPDRLVTTDLYSSRRIYTKVFSAGPVVLGGNHDAGMPTGYQMYTVVIEPVNDSNNDAAHWFFYQ